MPTISKTGRKIDLDILKGSTFSWFISLKEGQLPRNYTQADVDALTPIPVDTKHVVCTISPVGCDENNTQLADVVLTKGVDIETPVGEVGVIRLKLLSSMSEAFTWRNAHYKIEVTDTPTDKFIPAYGEINLLEPK